MVDSGSYIMSNKRIKHSNCLECNALLSKTQTKFCSTKCMNVFNGRLFKAQHKEENPDRYRVCDFCGEEKNIGQFSLLDKTRTTTTERKTTCKKYSASIRDKERRDKTWKYDARKILLCNAKQRAKKAGLEFTLIEEDIVIPDLCPVFGFPLKREDKQTWFSSPSIDRIDNTKGYTKDNIIIVSRRANILKRDATTEELVKLALYYERIRSGSSSSLSCPTTS